MRVIRALASWLVHVAVCCRHGLPLRFTGFLVYSTVFGAVHELGVWQLADADLKSIETEGKAHSRHGESIERNRVICCNGDLV